MTAKNGYPTSDANTRPFRVYHEQEGKILQGKCFTWALNAHDAAQRYARWWLKKGETVAVITNTGQELGQYTRRLDHVHASDNAPVTLAQVERQQVKHGRSV
jgi:hypothetical protein